MLGPIDLWKRIGTTAHHQDNVPDPMIAGIDAVILGTETGTQRREMKIEWAGSIVNQCDAAGVPLFIKQISINGKVSKDMNEWPEILQRRNLPWL